jgi:hypothetical protein
VLCQCARHHAAGRQPSPARAAAPPVARSRQFHRPTHRPTPEHVTQRHRRGGRASLVPAFSTGRARARSRRGRGCRSGGRVRSRPRGARSKAELLGAGEFPRSSTSKPR